MFKTTSKERVHAAMTTPSLPELKRLKLETELQDQGSTCHQSPREVHHPGQGVSVDSVLYGPFNYQAFTVSEDLRKEAIGLPR